MLEKQKIKGQNRPNGSICSMTSKIVVDPNNLDEKALSMRLSWNTLHGGA